MSAVDKLREVFNGNNACESIYDDAAPNLQSMGKTAWLTECGQFRADWGFWRSFAPMSAIRCGMPETVICVDGTGEFPKGNRTLEIVWLLDGGRVHFVTLRWQLAGDLWMALPPRTSPDHHFDSPPVPGKDRAKSG